MSSAKTVSVGRRKRISSEDRRDQILTEAAQLFSRKGFNGATTKEIAEAVGVSEAIIFRHFPSKQDLYSAILDAKASECNQQIWSSSENDMPKKDDKSVFCSLATEILETHRKDPTLMRLLYYCGLEGHEMARSFFNTNAQLARGRIANYIKQRIQDGAFRKINPEVAARSFFGMVMQCAVVRELFHDTQLQKSSSREAAKEITDIFLNGISAQSPLKR